LHEVENLTFSVSYTTRKPRGAEVDGEAYHFIDRPAFERRIAAGEFLEYAQVFGNYYGTHSNELTLAEAAGKDLVLDIDVQGAAQLKERIPDAVSIFVLAPSREVLEMRLRARSQDNEEVIRRRLADAAKEIGNWNLYDYVLVNEQLDAAAETLKAIVKAERVKRTRVEKQIRPILASFEQELGAKK
jgi:guanylate kinase